MNKFSLIYEGKLADQGILDLYVASASYYGLARTLAIIGHYYVSGEIIAHAPRSKMPIYILPPQPGSFKQHVAAAAIGGMIAAPFSTYAGMMMASWIPQPNPQLQQMIKLLQEQNVLLRKQAGIKEVPTSEESGIEEKVKRHLENHSNECQMLRSITSNSFKSTFRPIGRSADKVGIVEGDQEKPIGAVDVQVLARLEADALDEKDSTLVGTVYSFSKSSKIGHIYVPDDARSYRFEYVHSGRLPPEDKFSWSQYYNKKITCTGRFVRFFDGKIKKFRVYHVEKTPEEDLTPLQ